MRAIALMVGTLAVLLVGCSEGDAPTSAPGAGASPGFYLVSGDRTFAVDVHDSPEKTQDDIVRAAKQLWNELPPGRFVEFHVEGRSALDVSAKRTRDQRAGSTPEITNISGRAQITTTSTPYRMFKDRDGSSGIEEAREEPTGPELRSGPAIGWAEIEEDIRERAFSTGSLEMMLFGGRDR